MSQTGKFNTPELIANHLRREILARKYKANQPLRQDHIASELGVSKIPLREALVQLKSEGLVLFLPKRGAVVSELSASGAAEIYTMRIALETVALAKAIDHLTPAVLIRARSILDIIDSGTEAGKWSELNWEFHALLYRSANMPLLLETILQLHNNVSRYLVFYLNHDVAAQDSQKEHRELLLACEKNDISMAKKILTEHLQRASDYLVLKLSAAQE